jgi:putative ABC transport system permease protein
MLKNWIRIFLYQMKSNKLFTALNILGLSLGIAGLVFAILYWNDEKSYNAWVPENDRIFQVVNDLGDLNIWATNISQTGPLLKTYAPQVESYCYLNDWYYDEIISYKGKKELISKILDSQKNFFSFYPFEFVKGNAKNALPDKSSIALSEYAAKRLFGDEDPMNKQVQYSGRTLTVTSVYKIEGKSSFEPYVVTNIIDDRLKDDSARDQWGNFSYGLLVKLKNPDQKAAVEKAIEKIYYENRIKRYAKVEGISPEEYAKKNGITKVYLEQMNDLRLHSIASGNPEGKGNYQFLLIMLGLSVLILILSIVNYVNLATANAIKRAKEVGVRKILGATKANIIRQFIFETTLTTAFSILIALVIVELSLPYYNEFLGKELIIYGSQFYTELALILMVVILTAGIFPAIYVSNFEALKVLKGNFGRSKSGVWLRNGMLILQFTIASFFIIGSYIVHEQVLYMSSKDLGFKGGQVLQIKYRNVYDYKEEDYTKKLVNKYYMIKQEAGKIHGVEKVSIGTFGFGAGPSSSSSYSYNDVSIQGTNMAVDFDMLEMLNVKMAMGRNLSEKFASDTISSMMINETAMRMMKEKNPIGKKVQWNDKVLEIVGVVKDFHVNSPQEEIPPMTFFHFKTINWMLQNANNVYVKVEAENMEQTIAGLEKFWVTKVDTEYPFSYDFVDKNFARSYETYVKQKKLFSLLNIIVIIIALFGLFALASYSIQRRMKEIAIRKTLGAETQTLLHELSKQYIVFCIIGFVLALFPAYYLLDKWLSNFAYRIPITVSPFLIGFIVLLLLTLIVVLSKAYQATRINVLKYLKYE